MKEVSWSRSSTFLFLFCGQHLPKGYVVHSTQAGDANSQSFEKLLSYQLLPPDHPVFWKGRAQPWPHLTPTAQWVWSCLFLPSRARHLISTSVGTPVSCEYAISRFPRATEVCGADTAVHAPGLGTPRLCILGMLSNLFQSRSAGLVVSLPVWTIDISRKPGAVDKIVSKEGAAPRQCPPGTDVLLQCLHSYPGGESVAAAPLQPGVNWPCFLPLPGNSKQEAFVGICCILPTWLVLWAMNILISQQPPGCCHYSFHSGP